MILPPEALPLLAEFSPAFTEPTYRRFVALLLAAVPTTGRRTGANLLRTLGGLAPGRRTDYQRALSRAPWSAPGLGCALAGFILAHPVPDGPVILVGDDTVDGRPGKKVYGKARHRDPVRSTHSHTAWRYGHKWVVLAVLVRFPFASRAWALPILVDLYRSPEDDRRKRPHRTQAQLMCRLLRLMPIRFPDRSFVFVGDAGCGTHEVARFCRRHRGRLALVSKLHPEANLFEPPPPYRGNGRPPVKGARRPKPSEAVSAARRLKRLSVAWHGGGTRRVETVAGDGHWYKSGHGLVPIRWVFVRDRDGTHRDEYLFTTDPAMGAAAVIGHYTSRWNIETTFEELRSHLGLETTRGWPRSTVLRAAPCLFGLYSVVAVLYRTLPEGKRPGAVDWPGKATVTFPDAVTAVRRWLWQGRVFPQAGCAEGLQKVPEPLREVLLTALAPAA
jgi:hypothetical protein